MKLISFNCHSFRRNIDIISSLLQQCDILLLQETYLTEDYSKELGNLGGMYGYYATPAVRDANCFTGRAKGGLAVIFHNKFGQFIEPFFYSDRIMGIFLSGGQRILILNLYLPCDYRNEESYLSYKNCLSNLNNISVMRDFDNLIMCGDLNADPHKGRFYRELVNHVNMLDLHIADVSYLPMDSYTFLSSQDCCSTSWLDHVIVSDSSLVSNFKIYYGTTLHDHIPIGCSVRSDFSISTEEENHTPSENFFIKWDRISDQSLEQYKINIDFFVHGVFNEGLECGALNCRSGSHINELTNLYDYLVGSCLDASDHLIVSCDARRYRQITGWNDHCKEHYQVARQCFLIWHDAGKPRFGQIFEDMKLTRNYFKNALNFCKRNKNLLAKEKLLQSHISGNKKAFWSQVRNITEKNNNDLAQNIDGLQDSKDIVRVFDSKFKLLFTENLSELNTNLCIHNDECNINSVYFDLEKINVAFDNLNDSMGWDLIHSNHVKLAGDGLKIFCSRFFTSILRHKFVPKEMLKGEFRPNLKDNKISKSKSDNYRPVMNSSVFLKIFELCLKPVLEANLKLNIRQFGFRKATNTIETVTLLKEIINDYNINKSSVFCGVIDLSKAFDRVSFNSLRKKLLRSTLPRNIIDIVDYMLRNTWVRTSYDGVYSESWLIMNGTRQGGILSPLIFNFYIAELLNDISECKIGCRLNNVQMNIMSYADDVMVLAPSANGLQFLIDKVETFFSEHGLVINFEKSKYVVFQHKKNFNGDIDIFLNRKKLVREKKCKYLGVVLEQDGCLEEDIDRCLSKFLGQFNGFFFKFKSVTDFCLMCEMFKTYCFSFYGLETWINISENKFKKVAVSYHKAIKRLCGLNRWDSNHVACETAALPIFKHMYARRIFKFYRRLITSRSPCLKIFKSYFYCFSSIACFVRVWFERFYNVQVDDYDELTILARIDYVQRTEERSNYVYVP